MQSTRRILAVLLVAGAFGCRAHERTGPANGSLAIVLSPAAVRSGDWASIGDASVTGDTLHLDVTYGGGCGKHEFQLRSDAAFRESEPVQVGVVLHHNGHGDMCRALVSQRVDFDLSPLRDLYRRAYRSSRGIIVLQLGVSGVAGESRSVRYTF